ncbi:MAG: nucleoside monophosphate kinase [Acidobacteria bacterium]|nr:nucleoside monophosphate kinase [Acidobacteriota bacterium]
MSLNVIMMGQPGAGKGTQATRFARARGLLKISTGDILRDSIKAGLPVALEAKRRMDSGELVDDATMIAIARDRLLRPDAAPGFVLDGFPRTVTQARALDEIVAERDNGALVIVDVMVPWDELVRRLAGRRICSLCGTNAEPFDSGHRCVKCGGEMVQRADDSSAVVLERLKVHQHATLPVLEFYRDRPTFRVVNGAQTPERVAQELDTMIDDAAAVGAALLKARQSS